MQQWESVSTRKNVKAGTENNYKIMFVIYVVTVVVYVFNLIHVVMVVCIGDSCVCWRQLCAVETVVATVRTFNI